jgi:hypothetical protein
MVGYLHLVVGGWGSTPIVSGATTTTGGWFLRYSCVSLTGLAVSTNPRGLLNVDRPQALANQHTPTLPDGDSDG